jgi:putative peptidoglycan lipid II flippase
VKKLISQANRVQTIGGAAVLMSVAYGLSRLLGLYRDRLLASHFGVGPVVDSYTAAFRLPDLLFSLLVSGAFAVAFIPVFSEYLVKEKRDEAWEVASSLFNILVLGTIIGSALIMIFADPLTTLVAPGFDSERHDLTVQLTRILAITPVFFAISSVFGSVAQAFNRFRIFSFASVFYNLGIIFGIVILGDQFGIYGVAYGVVLGTILQAVVQVLGLAGLGVGYKPHMRFRLPGVRKVLRLMVPRTLDQGIDQINYTVETIIGSALAAGSLTAYYYANNLKNVPLVLFATAISTAAFPQLARRAAKGNREELVASYLRTARLILFLAIPAALFAIVARGYIVRLLFGFGDTATANTLGWFAGTIIFTSLFQLVTRVFYALQDTKTPLKVSLISIPLNIVLSLIFAHVYGVMGLAMAASLVAVAETIYLLAVLRRREGNFGEFKLFMAGLSMGLAATVMAGITYFVIHRVVPLYATDKGFLVIAPKFAIILATAAITYILMSLLLRIPEINQLGRRFYFMAKKPFNSLT